MRWEGDPASFTANTTCKKHNICRSRFSCCTKSKTKACSNICFHSAAGTPCETELYLGILRQEAQQTAGHGHSSCAYYASPGCCWSLHVAQALPVAPAVLKPVPCKSKHDSGGAHKLLPTRLCCGGSPCRGFLDSCRGLKDLAGMRCGLFGVH